MLVLVIAMRMRVAVRMVMMVMIVMVVIMIMILAVMMMMIVVMIVIVMMIMIVAMSVMMRDMRGESQSGAQPSRKLAQPDANYNCAANEAQRGKEFFRQDLLRAGECHNAEREDAGGVRDSYGQTEKGGVLRRAARTDQIGSDDSFTVPGRHRV